MGKICPEMSSRSSQYITASRETFTVWMKSLVFNGKGCTAFNSKGEITFRIDNYQEKCSSEVNLMDSKGQALFSIQRKRLSFFGDWNIFKWSETNMGKEDPWFRVRKRFNVRRSDVTACTISICFDKSKRGCYKIIKINRNSAFKIIDSANHLVAQVHIFTFFYYIGMYNILLNYN
ncbi:hypothetical protein Leryth_027597 [Lithospermum erythrorhizon]|nr:hypothetical protein Leryth_027597 [Lithospermum erythrorhizon]